jgi:hypothetical protein
MVLRNRDRMIPLPGMMFFGTGRSCTMTPVTNEFWPL